MTPSSDLHVLLERATDRLEARDLVGASVRAARRRRLFHQSVAAGAVALVVIVTAAYFEGLSGRHDDSAPPVAPPSGEVRTAQRWDPRGVDSLPAADPAVARLIPEVVDPPADMPALVDRPLAAAVLSIRSGRDIQLLGADGSWRSVPQRVDIGSTVELTDDGTRLAVSTDDGVDVWDLPTGERTHLDHPDGYVPWDYQSWEWRDSQTLLFDDYGPRGWLVDVATGAATRVPFPTQSRYVRAIDPDGVVLESADWGRPAVFTDWAGEEPHHTRMTMGRLASLQATSDVVVGTSYEKSAYAAYVLDRSDLSPRAVLRIQDFEGNYSGGGLTIAALLTDQTVLMRVVVSAARRAGGWWRGIPPPANSGW